MVRVKICGITNKDDALAASNAGADAIGMVFYDPSPRNVAISVASNIVDALPPFVTSVGLFVDPDPHFVESVIRYCHLDLLQFHGDETPSECARYCLPYIKAIRMREDVDLEQQARIYHSSRGILLDTYISGQAGGTGKTFDWSRIPSDISKPIVLAGGLTPDNVSNAISVANPWAVDVSGGVEKSKGIKDPALISAFMEGVHSVSK